LCQVRYSFFFQWFVFRAPIDNPAGLFAGLEWGRFPNFEAASFTLTSVAIILPLGTLTAQQLGPGGSLAYLSGRSNRSDASNLKEKPSFRAATSTANSGVSPGVSVTCGSDGRNLSLASSCKKDQHSRDAKLDHYDLELRHIDSTRALTPHGGVRVDTDLEQQETRI
jgi:pheromone alpha factor receptor